MKLEIEMYFYPSKCGFLVSLVVDVDDDDDDDDDVVVVVVQKNFDDLQ